MSKKHWITIDGNADITREKICSLIDTSYELVIKGLPKKKQVFFQTRYSLVEYNSAEYIEALSLRNEVLRKPLGLSFNKEDIEKEQFNDLHIVAKYNDTIIGCMILSPIDSSTVKMRQVAIHPKYQGIGIGSELVKFADSACIEKNIQEIVLHARLTAQSFYEHAGYQSIGDIFTEVGIPHIMMRKPV